MPRRRAADAEGGVAPTPKPRVRRKKEPASVMSTPSIGESMKMEAGDLLLGSSPMMFEQMPGSGNVPGAVQSQQQPPNGGMMLNHEDVMGQSPSVGGMPPYSATPHGEFFFHGGHPGGPIPPQPMYAGMPPQQQSQPNPHMQPSRQHHPSFAEPETPLQQQPPPPFMYQQPPQMPNGPPHGVPQPPPAGGPPPPMMLRQIPMQPFGPNFPQPPFLEFRLQEMNRRLYSFHNSQYTLSMQDHAQWWEAFAHEFFDNDAKMTVSLFDIADMAFKKYTIGRLLIPRFYRTIFDNGVCEMYYLVRMQAQERIGQWGTCALDCENVLMVTRQDTPVHSEVHTDCRLLVDFAPFDENVGYRIRHWAIEMRQSQEYYRIPKEDNGPHQLELVKTGAGTGLPQAAIHYLKLCLILEPMQMLMRHTKMNNSAPRDALSAVLFDHHRRMNPQQQMPPQMGMSMGQQAPPHSVASTDENPGKKPPRKRTRKTTPNSNAGNPTPGSKKKGAAAAAAAAAASQQGESPILTQPPNAQNFPPNHPAMFNQMMQYPQDVLIVGEPSMMGTDFGEDDERSISRIENTQYDPNNQCTSSASNMPPNPQQMQQHQPITSTPSVHGSGDPSQVFMANNFDMHPPSSMANNGSNWPPASGPLATTGAPTTTG